MTLYVLLHVAERWFIITSAQVKAEFYKCSSERRLQYLLLIVFVWEKVSSQT